MKYEIKNRLTGKVQFTAEIECDESAATSSKIGLAVRWGLKSYANLRGADLRGADLSYANLRGAYLRGANLRDAHLRGANLRDAHLRGADLRGADLRDAHLRGADLSGAYLSDAYLRDCPVKIENIHKAVYDAASKDGALDMDDWDCGTSHCRAGWVVTLAGDGGKALEWAYGTPAAAAIIYMASDPSLEKIPDFYATNEDALADMKRLAEAA